MDSIELGGCAVLGLELNDLEGLAGHGVEQRPGQLCIDGTAGRGQPVDSDIGGRRLTTCGVVVERGAARSSAMQR